MKGKILAIIPARGGSKGIPGKNIKELNGKPLMAYTIEEALKCPEIDRVVVSTDSKEIAQVAEKYGADVEKAVIAGILYDVTKETPYDIQLKIMQENGIILDSVQQVSPKLWHAISGSVYVKTQLGITDAEILNAIRYHTSGRENMSLLEKVIFVADFIGEERDYKGVDVMRKKAESSLDEAMLYGVTFSITDLAARQCAIDQNTLALYNQLIINNNK